MPTVSLVRVQDDQIDAAVRQAMEQAGAADVLFSGASVLLKPNLVKPSPSGSGRITDARVTEAVARAVLDCSPSQVIIGEGSSVGYDIAGMVDTYTAMEESGTADVAHKLGLAMVELKSQIRSNRYQVGFLIWNFQPYRRVFLVTPFFNGILTHIDEYRCGIRK